MKMKNSELVETMNNLDVFLKKDIPFPVRISYAVHKNMKKLKDECAIYEPEREKIMDGYEEKNKEQKKEALKKLRELLDIEIEINNIQKITMGDIESCGNLSVNDITALSFMIEEEEYE